MNSPNVEKMQKLIAEAPIGRYIGEGGAQILAERACSEMKLKSEEFLYHQGDLADSFYFLCKGRLAVVAERKNNKKPSIRHVLEEGDLVGELSFFDNTPQTESVIALGDATILRFAAEDFKPLITEHPQLMFDFMRAVIKRVHQTVANIAKQQAALSDYISSAGKGRL